MKIKPNITSKSLDKKYGKHKDECGFASFLSREDAALKVKIRNSNWSVILGDTQDCVLEGNLGMCCYMQNELHIAKNAKKDMRVETFYHELSHAILAESHYNVIIKEYLGDKYELFVSNLGDVIQNMNWENVKKISKEI